MTVFRAALQLTRPANLVTAIADILAGIAIAGVGFNWENAYWLIFSTLGLYGGGVVLNDVFDAQIDAVERPERPIPSGRISFRTAAVLGVLLLVFGIVTAVNYSRISGWIAVIIALATIVYNRFAKHSRLFGPLVMGFCRGGNLLLGVSAVPAALELWWPLGFIPLIYIAAITLISQDEVHGGKRIYLYLASLFYAIVHVAQGIIAYKNGYFVMAVVLIGLHAVLIGKPLWAAVESPVGNKIGKAVKAGVISLIVMDAAWCMAFGSYALAFIVLLLLPLSIKLGKMFAVT